MYGFHLWGAPGASAPTSASSSDDQAKRHFDHIDGLRAVAILSVVGYHAFPKAVPGGFAGVDIFFVISGFLITGLIVRELDANTFSLISFFARRARRLLPAAAVVYAATALAGALILLPDAFREFGTSLGGASLIYANRQFYKLADYFEAPAHEKPLLHTWSLSIEEQFYLLWPLLLMLLLPRLPRRFLLLGVALTLAVSLGYAQRMLGHDQRYAFYMLQTRAWELLTGAVLALLIPTALISEAAAATIAWTGSVMIAGSLFLLGTQSPFPGLYAVPACAGTALVLAACHRNSPSIRRLLSMPAIVFVGLISYSLYLWHWPVLSLAHYAVERPLQGFELLLALLAAGVAATCSWAWIERPFRLPGGALWLPDKPILIGAVLTMGLFAALGRVLVVTDGLPGRLDEAGRRVFEQKISQNPKRLDCENVENAFRNDSFCTIGRPKADGASYDAVIIGDSHADQFVPAFAPLIERAGLTARQLTQNGCGLLIGLARRVETSEAKYKPCPDFQETIKQFVVSNPRLKLAILSTYWPAYEQAPRLNGIEMPPGIARPTATGGARDVFEQYLRTMLMFFEQRGIRVVLVGGVPQIDKDLPMRCAVKARRSAQAGRTCEIPSAPIIAQLAWSNALLQRLSRENPNISVVLPTDAMCSQQGCATVIDGVFLYFDRTHINAAGSELLGRGFSLPDLGANLRDTGGTAGLTVK